MRTILRAFLVSGVAAVLVAVPGPAPAGGAMFDWDRYAYEPGDVVSGSTGVWIPKDYGGPADGPYLAYLSPLGAEGDYPEPPEGAIYVGDIVVDPNEDGDEFTQAHLRFTMPEVPAGDYVVHHCNDPCTTSLGDIIPSYIRVVGSAVEARLIKRLDRLETKVSDIGIVLPRRERRLEGELGARITEISQRVDVLTKRVEAIEQLSNDTDDQALSYLAGAGLLGLGAGLLTRSRRRSSRSRNRS